MKRMLMMATPFIFLAAMISDLSAAPGVPLLNDRQIQHLGLTRAWFNQVKMDTATSRVADVSLFGDLLLVTTDRGKLHAMDSQTGQTLWTNQVGEPHRITLQPGANKKLVGVINGMHLYLLRRSDGKILRTQKLVSGAGSGCALSEKYVYLPMLTGMLYGYELVEAESASPILEEIQKDLDLTPEQIERLYGPPEERQTEYQLAQDVPPPVATAFFGRGLIPPIIGREMQTEEFVAWPTDRGILFLGHNDTRNGKMTLRYSVDLEPQTVYLDPSHLSRTEFQRPNAISALPVYSQPDPSELGSPSLMIVGTQEGFVYALNDRDGKIFWQFSTGDPVVERVAVIQDRVYVPTQSEGMYCLDNKTGEMIWWVPNIVRFVSASKDHLYVMNQLDQLVVLDSEKGVPLEHFDSLAYDHELYNIQTDRIYLVTATGLVQCLHESGLGEPIEHRFTKEQIAEAEAKLIEERKKAFTGGTTQPAPDEEAPPQGGSPFDQPAAPETGNPFEMGGADQAPGAAEPTDEDQADPFGGNPFGADPFGDNSGEEETPAPAEEEAAPTDDPFADNPFN